MVQQFQPVFHDGKLRSFPKVMDENNNEKPAGKPSPTQLKNDSIANELVNARKVLGWTQTELHQRTGISRETIKQYETGRNLPGAREIRLLSAALKISPNRLLLGTEDFDSSMSPLKGLAKAGDGVTDAEGFRAYMQFLGIYAFLLPSERAAILTLIEPILLSRKSAQDVKTMLDMFGEMADVTWPIMGQMNAKKDEDGKT